MGIYVDFYCGNNNSELKKIVFPILMNKFGWIPQKDYDDFLSIGSQVVWNCEENFDLEKVKTKKFKSFLSNCIHNKIKTQLTYMHRDKRVLKDNNGNPIYDTSIDLQIGDDESMTLGDTIHSDFDMDSIIFGKYEYGENVEELLNNLSEIPKKIVQLIMIGNSVDEIKQILNLSDREYRDNWKIINSYENRRLLYKDNNDENVEDDEMVTNIAMDNVTESYKNTSYSIESISKQLRKKKIRDDHILQRHSGQWKGFAKSELISDILRGKSLTQIIISEEIKNGLRMQWLIDGKQRCTTLDDFLHDGFSISKNVKNYNIRYQTVKIDDNGNEVLNEDGFTDMEYKDFDIRGKKFSQLPEELQEVFKDRQIPVLYNMNCTKKDIADDIARFNRSRPMNKAQNGWLGLDEEFAEFVENIAKMPFFQPGFSGSTYTPNNINSGLIRRIIVEGIMASDFIDDFNKDFEKMCEFLSEEASDSNFTEFYALIERLTTISNQNVAKLFDSKDSFLWFGLFSRFINIENNDIKFISFLEEFDKNLRNKKVNGISFEDLCINPNSGKSCSTKDKSIVVKKIELLETLMKEYLHIEETENDEFEESSVLDFVKNNVNPDTTEEDIEEYEEFYEDDLKIEVDNSSKLLEESNTKSMLALIAYVMNSNIKLNAFKKWLVDFFDQNNTYKTNQTENYIYMRNSLQKMIAE